MKAVIMVLILVLLAACVQINEEIPVIEPDASEPAVEEPAEEPEPTALAPLPEPPKKMSKTVGPAVVPKSVPVNSTSQPKTVASGWTTESLSIAEGETKFVYIDEPALP